MRAILILALAVSSCLDLAKAWGEGEAGGLPSAIGVGFASDAKKKEALEALTAEAEKYAGQRNTWAVEQIYRKMLAIAPNNAYALVHLGTLVAKGAGDAAKFDEALDLLTKAAAADPKNAVVHNFLGIIASQKGWQAMARMELETAVALDPKYADAHFNLAVVFATVTPPDKENARIYYARAVELGAERDEALEKLVDWKKTKSEAK